MCVLNDTCLVLFYYSCTIITVITQSIVIIILWCIPLLSLYFCIKGNEMYYQMAWILHFSETMPEVSVLCNSWCTVLELGLSVFVYIYIYYIIYCCHIQLQKIIKRPHWFCLQSAFLPILWQFESFWVEPTQHREIYHPTGWVPFYPNAAFKITHHL